MEGSRDARSYDANSTRGGRDDPRVDVTSDDGERLGVTGGDVGILELDCAWTAGFPEHHARFAPADLLTRAQMAVFVSRTLDALLA